MFHPASSTQYTPSARHRTAKAEDRALTYHYSVVNIIINIVITIFITIIIIIILFTNVNIVIIILVFYYCYIVFLLLTKCFRMESRNHTALDLAHDKKQKIIIIIFLCYHYKSVGTLKGLYSAILPKQTASRLHEEQTCK